MTLHERLTRLGWTREPRRDMAVYRREFSGMRLTITEWHVAPERDAEQRRSNPNFPKRGVRLREFTVTVSDESGYGKRPILAHGSPSSKNLVALAQHATGAARRLISRGRLRRYVEAWTRDRGPMVEARAELALEFPL